MKTSSLLRRLTAVVPLLWLTASCAQSELGDTDDRRDAGQDTELDTTAQTDTSVSPDVAVREPRGFGEACRIGADCISGFCVPSGTDAPNICTQQCVGACPYEGYVCEAVDYAGVGSVELCAPDLNACGGEGVCWPGEVRQEEDTCGPCGGDAIRARARVCNLECQWDAWGPWSPCPEEDILCEPGEVETVREACGGCGAGVRYRSRECTATCEWLDWSAWGLCEVAVECTTGEVERESQACGAGGLQTRERSCDALSCTWEAWSEWSACSAASECTSGDRQTETLPCGVCGEGFQERERVCVTGSWQAWSEWGTCWGVGVCEPGTYDAETEPCGCGARERRRYCDPATCNWWPWGSWGACSGTSGACTPGETSTAGCDPCSIQTCRDDCLWTGCQLREGAECEWQDGTNWECCGAGSWHFCLPDTCTWSTECEACSGEGCGC